MATVKLENVKKIYQGNVVAVHDFNLDIGDKEFIVFVGPSGCGKSTTLRMIAGLEEISEGTVKIDDVIVNDMQPKDRKISMVFQNYALYPHLTVFENMAFPLRLIKQKKLVALNEQQIAKNNEAIAKLNTKIAALTEEHTKYVASLAGDEVYEKAIAEIDAKLAELEAKEAQRVTDVTNEIETLTAFKKELQASATDKTRKKIDRKVEAINEKLDNLLTAKKIPDIKYFELKTKLTKKRNELSGEALLEKINEVKAEVAFLEDEIANGRATFVKMSQDEIYKKVTETAETLGITDYLLRKPKALSGGQRQRVAIGRAMVRDSKVLLMDEPLSNLDAKLRNQMRAEIILLRQRIDTTFIYVTHDQTEAMTLGDRIVIMKDGYIMQVGTPTQVFDEPDNLFVAQFIGAPMMNTTKCQLTYEDGKYYVAPYGHKLLVDGHKAERLLAHNVKDQEIILGFRPEHVELVKEGGIPATIQVNEMMGSELHLHVLTETGAKLIVRVPTIRLTNEERAELVYGHKINVTFGGKVMHFFDPTTEESLIK